MDVNDVRAYFESDGVVEHYANAAGRLGLWVSEEKIFTRLFDCGDSLLELGCGAGRIAIGLHELGYKNILATDYSKPMVERARGLTKILEYPIQIHVADACQLKFEDGVFDGAIFGFNGLMQIPGLAQREQALREIFRVIRSGAWFVFTSHDRDRSPHQKFWSYERGLWERNEHRKDLDDFGDRAQQTPDGLHFMHVPTVDEVTSLVEAIGFRVEASVMRSEIAAEPQEVLDFSDECRFWVLQKPASAS